MLNEDEIEALPIAPIVITYELGIRFLTDYLEGDVYFKIKHHDHNKDRVRAQFALVQSMQRSFEEMKQIFLSQKVRKLVSFKFRKMNRRLFKTKVEDSCPGSNLEIGYHP